MASLIPGYEYDVFISYRQKDNKHDGWVTEFVDNLKGELESTFKEEISVYFDINPHDGLLETHDVDASLKDKLKCLVFIPIISRTYCDPNSFAWEHEFKAFVEQASQDQFGLKVKLPNGNVANRVLPVRIYDLDNSDIQLCESILGSMLRGVEFIYKEPGVNRPLRANEENPHDILNHTIYRNQINKVANAVKELITALEQPEQKHEDLSKEAYKPLPVHRKNHKAKILAGSIIALALIIIGILFVPKLIKPEEPVEKSIAVLPFISLSDDPTQQYLADGMMDAILLHLQKFKDLRVLSRTSVEQYRHPVKTTNAIGRELGVEYLLEGSFQKSGDSVRLIVQLIKTGKEGHIWANNYDRKWNNVFFVQSEVAQTIAKELYASITPEEKLLIEKIPTGNMTAYEFYLKANDFVKEYEKTRDLSSYYTAVNLYKIAIEKDSTFAKSYTGWASAYYDRYQWETYFKKNYLDSMLVLTNKAYSIDDQLDEVYYLKGVYNYQNGKPEEALDNFDKALIINPNYYAAFERKGYILTWILFDFVRSIDNYNKALNLIQGDGRVGIMQNLGLAYMNAGFTEKAKDYFEQAVIQNGDSAMYFSLLASLEFSKGNLENAILLNEKATKLNSAIIPVIEWYSFAGQDQKAYSAAEKAVEGLKKTGSFPLQYSHRIGYAYWKAGKESEARYYFNLQIKYGEESIHLGREYALNKTAHFDLAGVYAFLGDKAKAYQYLEELNKTVYPLGGISYLKYDILFDHIRNEERFQKTLNNVEAKYQAEHERVRKWLEENKML